MRSVAGFVCGVALAACVDDPSMIDAVRPHDEATALELIGVSGRRLEDGDAYRLPLDYEAVALPVGVARREAFVLRNPTRRVLVVLTLALAAAPEDGGPVAGAAASPWALLAPVRARAVPLDARGLRLLPGERLDFDVALTPTTTGEHSASLELVVSWPDHVEARAVALEATARGPP